MRYVFADCVLDTQLYTLHRAGTVIRLRPKAFRVLQYLIEHCDRMVSKDELCADVWPDQFISDATLEGCIKLARQAIGDSGRVQQLIQSRRGYGYRFVGTVEEHLANPTAQGAVVPPEAESSPLSGPPLLPAQSVPTGERKLVTLLSCTLVPASGDAAPLELETLHRQMRALYAGAQREVQHYGGTIQSVTGDRLLAMFGAPLAQEDHAQRAVLAALGLQQRLTEPPAVNSDLAHGSLRVSIGLHTTPVIVETLGDPAASVPVIIGETSRVLDVLQTHMVPGTVVCSDTTAHWIRDMVHLTPVPPVQGPGQSAPPRVYQLLGLHSPQRPGAWQERQGLGPFVGRTHELATLHTALTQVEAGRGQVVGIVGEPGMGKSRLLYEFQGSLRDTPVMYLEGHCISYGSTSPYLPVRDLLRLHCGILDTDTADAMTAKLHTLLCEVGLAPDETAPYLLHLLGIDSDTQPFAALSPEAIRLRTFATLRQLHLHSSRQRPLILVVENLHWIDMTSEAYLISLVEQLAGAPLLLLTTYRPGYRPPWLAKSYASQTALPPLSFDDSRSLVQAISPTTQLHTPLLDAILARAEGNPLFLEELARAALEPTPASMAVPATIQGVLMTRLDRLPEAAKRVLQTASVLGRAIPQTLLEVCWDGPGDLATHLQELQRLEFLAMQAEDEVLYRFKHALTQEVAYESLPLLRRQALHATVGRLLEARYADRLEAVAERLAYHYARSAKATSAVTYLSLCAEQAIRSHAHIEAVALLQAALEHAARLPVEQREQRRLELVLRQAFSLSILGRFQDIHTLFLAHQECVEDLSDDRLTGPYYFRLGLTLHYLGNFELAVTHAWRAIEAAQRSGDIVTLGQAYYVRLHVSYSSSHYREAIAYGRQAITCLERVDMQHWHWLGMAQYLLGASYGHLGEFASGLTAVCEAEAIGAKIGDPRLQSFAALAIGLIQALRGAYNASIIACQRALERAPDPSSTAVALGYLGHAYIESAAPVKAMPILQQAIQQTRQSGFRSAEARFTTFLAEAYYLLGDLAPAQALAQQGLDLSRTVQYGYSVGLAQRTLGQVAQASDAWAEAEQHLQAALQTFMGLEARFEVARTHLSIAELARAQGKQDVSTASLQAASHLFTILQVPIYAERAASLAEAYGISLRAADTGKSGEGEAV